jgi:hypothetical protein
MSDAGDDYEPPIPAVPVNLPAPPDDFNLPGAPENPPTAPDEAELIRVWTENCQRLVEAAVSGRTSVDAFLDFLNETGVSPEEAQDYVDQVFQRHSQQGAPGPPPLPADQALAPPNPINAADALAWAVLQAKFNQLQGIGSHPAPSPSSTLLTDEVANFLGIPNSKGAIPAAVLAKAPHLAELAISVEADAHLEKTQELLTVFSPQATQEALVNKAQFASVAVPLPRTIWRKIILDHFVDFEKLFISMEKGYDHHDDPKDFGAGYTLVKKEQAFSKLKLRSKADWLCVFDAWSDGTSFFFHHRERELQVYRSIVSDLFHAAPNNAQVAIEFDVEVRDKYTWKPFHLDDRAQLNLPLLTQMFHGPSSILSSCSTNKCAAPSPSSGQAK